VSGFESVHKVEQFFFGSVRGDVVYFHCLLAGGDVVRIDFLCYFVRLVLPLEHSQGLNRHDHDVADADNAQLVVEDPCGAGLYEGVVGFLGAGFASVLVVVDSDEDGGKRDKV